VREPTQAERLAYRDGVTLDELDVLVPAYVRESIEEQSPSTTRVFVEIEREGAIGVIRTISVDTNEMLVDFGFREQYWATVDEVQLVDVRWTPPSAVAGI
jgi:hypothetical protein